MRLGCFGDVVLGETWWGEDRSFHHDPSWTHLVRRSDGGRDGVGMVHRPELIVLDRSNGVFFRGDYRAYDLLLSDKLLWFHLFHSSCLVSASHDLILKDLDEILSVHGRKVNRHVSFIRVWNWIFPFIASNWASGHLQEVKSSPQRMDVLLIGFLILNLLLSLISVPVRII